MGILIGEIRRGCCYDLTGCQHGDAVKVVPIRNEAEAAHDDPPTPSGIIFGGPVRGAVFWLIIGVAGTLVSKTAKL